MAKKYNIKTNHIKDKELLFADLAYLAFYQEIDFDLINDLINHNMLNLAVLLMETIV